MKKLFKLLMVALMICCLAACGGKNEGDGGEETVGGGSLVIYSPNTDALCAAAEVFGERLNVLDRKKITEEEAEELKKLIDEHKE